MVKYCIWPRGSLHFRFEHDSETSTDTSKTWAMRQTSTMTQAARKIIGSGSFHPCINILSNDEVRFPELLTAASGT